MFWQNGCVIMSCDPILAGKLVNQQCGSHGIICGGQIGLQQSHATFGRKEKKTNKKNNIKLSLTDKSHLTPK